MLRSIGFQKPLLVILTWLAGICITSGQTITRTGSDCANSTNTFNFVSGTGNVFQYWTASATFVMQSTATSLPLSGYWNTTGAGQVVAHYYNSSTGTSQTVSYSVNIVNPITISNSISIVSGPNPVCSTSSVQFKATPSSNVGVSPVYYWYVHGSLKLTSSTTNLFTWSTWSNGDDVVCKVQTTVSCISTPYWM